LGADHRRGASIDLRPRLVKPPRPGTAKGILFVTLEDESEPRGQESAARGILGSPAVEAKTPDEGPISRARAWPLAKLSPTPSHDFR